MLSGVEDGILKPSAGKHPLDVVVVPLPVVPFTPDDAFGFAAALLVELVLMTPVILGVPFLHLFLLLRFGVIAASSIAGARELSSRM